MTQTKVRNSPLTVTDLRRLSQLIETMDQQTLRFGLEYCNSFNPAVAVQRAKLHGGLQAGLKLLLDPNVQELNALLTRMNVLSETEVLKLLMDQATASIEEFLDLDQSPPVLDWKKAQRAGRLHLIRSARLATGEITLHDSQRALDLLAKHYGLIREQIDVSDLTEPLSDQERLQRALTIVKAAWSRSQKQGQGDGYEPESS